MTTLANRRAIVCGSTQGIGRACAEALARAGASVVLVARHGEALAAVSGGLSVAAGQQHRSVRADFSDYAGVEAAVGDELAANGPAHILINNTGGPPAGPAFDAEPDAYAAAFAQHLLCNQVLTRLVAPGMRDAAYGRIINIISTSVVTPIRNLGVSNTVRGAVANWGRTLAAELGPFGITVNNVLPGFTATARLAALIEGRARRAGGTVEDVEGQMKRTIPAGRFADPSELGAVVAFLASPAASYINGVNLPVDGGRLAAQ
ncbi:MAG: SDR family oxidoreductase [Phycisphaerales bacterium]|nr:SDR family oxidoreductase [Phycisphaerae bacterium]NNF44248.1 SDR family oxidoreductase [Phycisphaerales bacterium]NNM25082.1 SDR family oxidoreductase [Phycisphaerales bacterium]